MENNRNYALVMEGKDILNHGHHSRGHPYHKIHNSSSRIPINFYLYKMRLHYSPIDIANIESTSKQPPVRPAARPRSGNYRNVVSLGLGNSHLYAAAVFFGFDGMCSSREAEFSVSL